MRFLKSLVVSLLGLLLFFSLSLFGTVYMLNQTVLDRNFVSSELDRLDISGILKETFTQPYGQQIGEQLSAQLRQQLGQPVPQLGGRITTALDATITELDPWLKQQMKDVNNSFYDYMTGRSQTLSLRVPMAPVKDALKRNLKAAVQQAPELSAVPPAVKEQAAEGMSQSLVTQLPDTFDLSQALGPDFQKILAQVRQYTGYAATAYWGLIGLMVLLVLGMVLIERNIKTTARSLGTTCLTYAVFGYGIGWAMDYFMGGFSMPGLPDAAQKGLSDILKDFSAPMQTFSIVLGAIGVALIIVSLVVRSKPAAAKAKAEVEAKADTDIETKE